MAMRCSARRWRSTVSDLVAIATTGVLLPRFSSASSAAMYWSPGPIRWSEGRQNPMTSTSSSVSRTRSLRRWPRSVRGLCSPGVSTRMSWLCSVVTMPRIVWRVVWGLLDVIATLVPTSALVSVDLPAFGRPMRHANPARYLLLVLAHPARSSVSGAGSRRLDALHDDARDAVAAPRHPLGGQAQPCHLARGPEDRHPAEVLAMQPADGVDLVVLERRRRTARRGRRRASGGDPHAAVAELLDLGGLARRTRR